MSRLNAIENLVRVVPFACPMKELTSTNRTYGSAAINLYTQRLSGGRFLIPEIMKIDMDFPMIGLSNMADLPAFGVGEEGFGHKLLYETVIFRAGRGAVPGVNANSTSNPYDSAGHVAAFVRQKTIGFYATAANSFASFDLTNNDYHREKDLVVAGRGRLVPAGLLQIDAARYLYNDTDSFEVNSTGVTDNTPLYRSEVRGLIYYRFAVLTLFQMQYINAKFSTQAVYDETTKWDDENVSLQYVVPNPVGTKWNDPV